MSDDEYWDSVEPLTDEFSIGYTNGALCHLIDDSGFVRSEGYHSIEVEFPDTGPHNHVVFWGTRGASTHMISPIPEQAVRRSVEQEGGDDRR